MELSSQISNHASADESTLSSRISTMEVSSRGDQDEKKHIKGSGSSSSHGDSFPDDDDDDANDEDDDDEGDEPEDDEDEEAKSSEEEDEDAYALDDFGRKRRKMDLLYYKTVYNYQGFESFRDPKSRICGAIRPVPEERLPEGYLSAIHAAIKEHNEKQPQNGEDILQYKRIVRTNLQLVRGFMYFFTLEVTNARGESLFYELRVWDSLYEGYHVRIFRPALHYPPRDKI